MYLLNTTDGGGLGALIKLGVEDPHSALCLHLPLLRFLCGERNDGKKWQEALVAGR